MQDKVIIYNDVEEGTLALCFPCSNIHTLEDVALKDVPAGVAYKILDVADLPESDIFRDAWTADLAEPDGVGMGAEAFFKERGIT